MKGCLFKRIISLHIAVVIWRVRGIFGWLFCFCTTSESSAIIFFLVPCLAPADFKIQNGR